MSKPCFFLLKKTEGAKLVLSSTWRVKDEFVQDILNCLRSFGLSMERFYDITDPQYHSERQWEIAKWLSEHQDGRKVVWLALDDENLLDGAANEKFREQFQEHVVQTESHVGLTMKDAKKAVELWKAQL
mmetsp:Transcript_12101/g.21266  ORF Transcript_12101/g.21266 Transcript_12101/m.21266 type:complete len:129 (-) Transcript_12101:99-485(-)